MIPRHEQEMIWASKPMLRRVYGRWYERIHRVAPIDEFKLNIEVGSEGVTNQDARELGTSQEMCDVETYDFSVYASGTTVYGIDVLHHVEHPKKAMWNLAWMQSGNHVIWLEPDCASVLGWLVYSLHFEGLKRQRLASDWFIGRKFSMEEWRVVRVDRWCDLLHLVSGGWTGRQLLPDCASGLVEWISSVLSWFPSLFSTRMMVVLERR